MQTLTKRSVRFNIPSDSVEWDQIEEQEKKLYKEDHAKRLSERESEQKEEEENSDDSTINTHNENDDISEPFSSNPRYSTRQRSHSVATTSHKTLLENENNSNSPFSPLRSILKNSSIFKWTEEKEEEQKGPASFDGPRTRSYSTSSTTNNASPPSPSTVSSWRQKIQLFQQKFEKVWSFLTFQNVFEVRGPSNEPRPRKYKYQRQSV